MLVFPDGVTRGLFISTCRALEVMLVFLGRICLSMITWRHLLLPNHIRGVMRYVVAVLFLSSRFLPFPIRCVFAFPYRCFGSWCLPDKSHIWSVREVLLLRRSVHTAFAVCHMGLAVVFLGVLDCVVVGIFPAVGVVLRLRVLLVLFLVALLHNLPLAPVG